MKTAPESPLPPFCHAPVPALRPRWPAAVLAELHGPDRGAPAGSLHFTVKLRFTVKLALSRYS